MTFAFCLHSDLLVLNCFFCFAAYSGSIRQGDVVYLASHHSKLPYCALVERCDRSMVLCRWFYRHCELPSKLRTPLKPLDGELYLSTHRDENSADTVLGLCNVAVPPEKCDETTHICRHTYNLQASALEPIHEANWNVAVNHQCTSSSLRAATGVSLDFKKLKRPNFPLVRAVD